VGPQGAPPLGSVRARGYFALELRVLAALVLQMGIPRLLVLVDSGTLRTRKPRS
jgi:hypothetical protein